MKTSAILASVVFASAMILGGAPAFAKSGKVESVESGGRAIVIAGTKYKISGSKTKIMIGGKPGKRGDIKVGMECDAKGKGTAKTITCK